MLLGASLLLGPVESSVLVLIHGAMPGPSQGMKGAIGGSVYAYLLGRVHIGAIKVFVATVSVAGTAFGPPLFALGTAWLESSAPILFVSALPPLVVALAAPFFRLLNADSSVRWR